VNERRKEREQSCSFVPFLCSLCRRVNDLLLTKRLESGSLKSTRQFRLDSISSIERVRSKGSFV